MEKIKAEKITWTRNSIPHNRGLITKDMHVIEWHRTYRVAEVATGHITFNIKPPGQCVSYSQLCNISVRVSKASLSP